MDPLDARPLSMGNTNAKHEANALAVPLVKASPRLISLTQEGFVKGRDIVKHITRVEQHAKRLTWAQFQACIILLDMAAAFPSITMEFIFMVLTAMNISPSS